MPVRGRDDTPAASMKYTAMLLRSPRILSSLPDVAWTPLFWVPPGIVLVPGVDRYVQVRHRWPDTSPVTISPAPSTLVAGRNILIMHTEPQHAACSCEHHRYGKLFFRDSDEQNVSRVRRMPGPQRESRPKKKLWRVSR